MTDLKDLDDTVIQWNYKIENSKIQSYSHLKKERTTPTLLSRRILKISELPELWRIVVSFQQIVIPFTHFLPDVIFHEQGEGEEFSYPTDKHHVFLILLYSLSLKSYQ